MLTKLVYKYALVGLVSNGFGFVLYLLLTELYLDHKSAMTLLYLIGATISFWGNKLYAFKSEQNWGASVIKFVAAHAVGYALNYSLLALFSDHYGYPHQLVQAVAIFVVAAVLFVLFRYFVFPVNNLKERSN